MTQDTTQTISADVSRRKRQIPLFCAGILLIFLLCGGIMIAAALRPLTREAGSPPPTAEDFARFPFLIPQCETDLNTDFLQECGEHTIPFSLFGIPLYTTLTVADTVPPAFTLREYAVLGGGTVTAEDFITEVRDASPYTVECSPNGTVPEAGTHTVTLTFTDSFGNTSVGTTELHVYGTSNRIPVEAGSSSAELRAAIRREIPEASITEIPAAAELSAFDEATALIRIGERDFTLYLDVQDTTPPTAAMRDVVTTLDRVPSAMDFVSSVTDATAVTAAFVKTPDCTLPGEQSVEIRLTDEAGNTAEVRSALYVYDIPDRVILEAGIDQDIALDELLANAPECSLAQEYFFPRLPVGDHRIAVRTPNGTLDVRLTIMDLTPPEAVPMEVTLYLPSNTIPTPADFVEDITDASGVSVAFVEEVDFATPGRRAVPILLTDTSGNTTTVQSFLNIINDHTAPIITGVKNLSTYVNGRISYKSGVTATDRDGSSVTLSVDSSRVNLAVPGQYRIVYTATDDAGNTASSAAYVTVKEITEDVIRPYAESILEKILQSGMTEREKARAIYDWMTKNVAYVAYADKTYWMRAAYYGFINGRGDCYVYYAMSRILLDCAGIENMEICRDNPSSPHYWNLVNCGDGWYHFDTCPHYKQYPLTAFMLTDAEVEAYSKNKVKDYYSFDRSLYPATP